jgi:hypothetical protein
LLGNLVLRHQLVGSAHGIESGNHVIERGIENAIVADDATVFVAKSVGVKRLIDFIERYLRRGFVNEVSGLYVRIQIGGWCVNLFYNLSCRIDIKRSNWGSVDLLLTPLRPCLSFKPNWSIGFIQDVSCSHLWSGGKTNVFLFR